MDILHDMDALHNDEFGRAIAPGLVVTATTLFVPYTLIACISRDRRILMLRRAKPPFPGMWNFLGGKIESGESPNTAALRELREEARFDLSPERMRFRGLAVWPSEGPTHDMMGMFLFTVRIRPRVGSRQTSFFDEGSLAWLPESLILENAAGPVVPNFRLLMGVFRPTRSVPRLLIHWRDPLGHYAGRTMRLTQGWRSVDELRGPWTGKLCQFLPSSER
jgi:8-oxo-dGTP diphosphatase